MLRSVGEKSQIIAQKLRALKAQSGSHSPSIFTLKEKIPELEIKIDACFLSNPYATELFIKHLDSEIIQKNALREILEFYPSQNAQIAHTIAQNIGAQSQNIFVGNGAIEVIQAVIQNFVRGKIVVNIPTFSSYYEFVTPPCEAVFYELKKSDGFMLDVDDYLKFVKAQKPQSVVIINPNNPNGGYLDSQNLRYLVSELQDVENIIIDESFIHFAFEQDLELVSNMQLFREFENVILIKSMSKDFGIAGIRAGYGVMSEQKVSALLQNGYLWNSNGLSEYFFKLYERQSFLSEYEKVRKLYITQTQEFFRALGQIGGLKVYESKANFALLEIVDSDLSADDFILRLLVEFGIYTRTCKDKIGLSGEFVRLASRSKTENEIVLAAIRDILGR